MRNKLNVTISDVADYFGVSFATIYHWIKTINLPATKANNIWQFSPCEVISWADSTKYKKAKCRLSVPAFNCISAVDLFCGAGGLTCGLKKAGIDVVAGVDVDSGCEYPYSHNNHACFLNKSITNVCGEDVDALFVKNTVRLMAGCAPCQTFSTYNQKADSTDERWWLLLEFARLVREVRPELVTMENVPRLMEQDVFDIFVKNLKFYGYYVNYQIVRCADYGMPQHRSRMVLMASKFGDVPLLTSKEFGISQSTVKDVIGNLEPLRDGECSKTDPLHQCSKLSPLNLKRIRASRPGGTWRDWPRELVAECHKKEIGKGYGSVYARMEWDKPSPTITTQFYGYGNGRFGHPEQDRALSLREGAILQGFPMDYQFVKPGEPICMKTLGKMIGNAVPVTLGEIIGKSLVKHVKHYAQGKSASECHKPSG
ncbi:MAG: DNA cytosine methyltransferase [Proteobacteria bacterium]|nr:DNA cytosine methyltransferase [Pseudomonadota bacterium]